jgi:hypothetical protein
MLASTEGFALTHKSHQGGSGIECRSAHFLARGFLTSPASTCRDKKPPWRAGNYNAGADKPSEELLKLVSFFSDACLNGVGMLNAFEGNLKGSLHGKPRGAVRPQ